MTDGAGYDPLYLRGIDEFNRQDFFESHESWEAAWIEATGTDRQFYKGLIQAAVGLLHLTRENRHGAEKLSAGARRYLGPYRPCHMGLDVEKFLDDLSDCFSTAFSQFDRTAHPTIDEGTLPKIHLLEPNDSSRK